MSQPAKSALPLMIPQIFTQAESSSIICFRRSGPKKFKTTTPSQVQWLTDFELGKRTRLVLALDLHREATELRNKLKTENFHKWGYFADTPIEILNPLPDVRSYLSMYKDIMNDFCASGPPAIPVNPGLSLAIIRKTYGMAGLPQGMYREGYGHPCFGHLLICLSLPRGSAIHQLHDYFVGEFRKLPRFEIESAMKLLEDEKFKVQIPLGFCRLAGERNAVQVRDGLSKKYKGTGGFNFGNAIRLSLWRQYFERHPTMKWEIPVMVHQERIYSRAISEFPEESPFVSIEEGDNGYE